MLQKGRGERDKQRMKEEKGIEEKGKENKEDKDRQKESHK